MAFKQITFNYPKPDEYLGQFDNEQLQGTHTYDGPEDMWIFVDKETKKLAPSAYMEYEEGMDFQPAPHLDRQYTVFGKVIKGMEFIDKIKKGEGPNGSVKSPDKIISLKLK